MPGRKNDFFFKSNLSASLICFLGKSDTLILFIKQFSKNTRTLNNYLFCWFKWKVS